MGIPSPKERPDLYDAYDGPAAPRKEDKAYTESITPDWLRNKKPKKPPPQKTR